MIKLTEFTSVVDTYKKNFAIRSKRFSDKKKKDQAVNKEQREARIESKKFFSSVGAKVAEKIKPGGNILDTVIRFAGFTLLGVLVKNLNKVAAFAKQVIEKVKEFAVRFKKYFDDVLVPLFNDIVGLGTQIKDTFGDIANFVIRMNPYNELSDVLETVMSGILALGYRIAGLYRPFTTPTTPGVTAPPPKSLPVRKPAPVAATVYKKTPVTKPVAKPVKTKVRTTTRVSERTLVGTGAKSGGSIQKPPSTIVKTLVDAFRELSDEEISKLLNDNDSDVRKAAKIVGEERITKSLLKPSPDSPLEREIRKKQEGGIKVDNAKVKEAGELRKQEAARKKIMSANTPSGVKVSFKKYLQRIQKIFDTPYNFEEQEFKAPKLPKPTLKPKLKFYQGLDFRFDAKSLVKNQILNPINLFKNVGSFALGLGLDVGAKFLGKYISSILPYNEDFELLAYLGMIDPDRIHQLTAGKIINLPEDKRIRAIERLERDSKSSDDIFGTGQKKREVANGILKYISIFSGGEIAPDVKPKVPAVVAPKQIPESLINKPDPTGIPKKKSADDEFVYPDGSILRPGMTVGKLNNTGGLDGPTTYGSQGVMISREVVIAIQPVEVPA